MVLIQHFNLHDWTAIFSNSIQGAMTTREGVYHSPHGTVECLSQSYHMELANPSTTTTTRLRMVYSGVGQEYTDERFYDAEELALLAKLFANRVAEQASTKHLVLHETTSCAAA
jgi:hypothetical protein